MKGWSAEIRKNSHKTLQLIDAEPLTAMQLNQRRLKDSKSECKSSKCVDEAVACKTVYTYVSGLILNVAVMHGLLRGVRVFVKNFDKFLSGGKLEYHIILDFWAKSLSTLAGIIREADPWFNDKNAMFDEIFADFTRKIEDGVFYKPEFLRAMDLYTNKGINL